MEVEQALGSAFSPPLAMTTLSLAERRKARFTFLPPPADRSDPLAIVELGRSAEVLLLLLPGDMNTETIDEAGSAALGVLRALGLPGIVGLVQSPAASAEGKNALKERAAAKKHATNALQEQLPGDNKLLAVDTPLDFKQLLRHLADAAPAVPHWRQQRPAVMVESAEFRPATAAAADGAAAAGAEGQAEGQAGATGTLLLRGYVRGPGLSANQAVHIGGAGDFQLSQIDGPQEHAPANEQQLGSEAAPRRQQQGAAAAAAAAMDTTGGEAGDVPVLARADLQQQESLVRENTADPLMGEQTWPTEEELMEAEAAAPKRKRRLPRGTSAYQAAWILDDSDLDDTDLESESEEEGAGASIRGGRGAGASVRGGASTRGDGDSDGEEMPDFEPNEGGGFGPGTGTGGGSSFKDLGDDTGTEFGMEYEDEEEGDRLKGMATTLKERRRQEQDEQLFPDEVDTPEGVAARVRFDKYRGLKSFRTSPWDPRESLPRDYARVFAFENFRRAHKRALEVARRAGSAGHPGSVAGGTYVQLQVTGVPADAAARVLARVAACRGEGGQEGASPLVVFGLLQHECKLSVQHYGMRKASSYEDPLPSKDPLLVVNGLRTFRARPIYSSDEHGADKHKMERFLHDGRPAVATVYAPISYPPLPVLFFKESADGSAPARLAASGSLRSCDPDRIMLKKIVLSGFPVKVHKTKAVVRFMFHNPEDIRWFRPVELWTKGGRRGRIREPVGTHGAFKAIFDGTLKQQDAICMSLYKRVFPKWPEDMNFVA